MEQEQIMGCTNRGTTSKLQDVIIPLYTESVRMHLEYCVQFWNPHFKKNMDRVELRVTRVIGGLETKPCKERLRDLVNV